MHFVILYRAIGRDSSFQDDEPITLQEAGEYILRVSGQGDARGDYGFVVWDVPSYVPQAIAVDIPVPGAIALPGQTRTYQFSGVAGQEITFDEIFGPLNHIKYTLIDPSGGMVFDAVVNDENVPSLPETGTYTLRVDGATDGVGSFSFQIADGNTPPPIPAAADLAVTRVDAPRRVVSPAASIEVQWDVTNQPRKRCSTYRHGDYRPTAFVGRRQAHRSRH